MVIVSWEGERTEVAHWRGWRSSKDLNGEGDTSLYVIGSLFKRFSIRKVGV